MTIREKMEALIEKGPSAQKYGVSPAARKRNAAMYYKAAEKLKDLNQKKLMLRIAMAVEDGEAKEAIELFGKLSQGARRLVRRHESVRPRMNDLLEAKRGAGQAQVVSVMKELLKKHWSEFDLPVPGVKLVNKSHGKYLARCHWRPGDNNTTMEVQRMAMGNADTLRRVMAHELIHHWDFLTRDQSRNVALAKMRVKPDAHGAHFLQQAARINSMEGPDYVSVKSDQSYDTSRVPPFYILITPFKGRYVWNIALRPSKKQKEIIVKRMAQYQSRLFKSTDGRLFHGAQKINTRSFSSSPDPEIKKAVEEMYLKGKTIELKP